MSDFGGDFGDFEDFEDSSQWSRHASEPRDNDILPVTDKPSTLLESETYEAAVAVMRSAPGTVYTFDINRSQLVPWLWPMEQGGAFVQPKSLENVLRKNNIEYPFCLCVYLHNNKRVSRPTTLRRSAGSILFVCRLSKGACGYSVSLEQWNSELCRGAPILNLKDRRGYCFDYALLEENRRVVEDLHGQVLGSRPSLRDSSKTSGKVRSGFQDRPRANPYPEPGKTRQPSSALTTRVPRPYAISHFSQPVPSTSRSLVPFDIKSHIPDDLLALIDNLLSCGVGMKDFDTAIIQCRGCRRYIYKPARDSHMCDLT